LALLSKRSCHPIREIGGVGSVCVNQTAEKEPNKKADLELPNARILIALAYPCNDIADAAGELWVLKISRVRIDYGLIRRGVRLVKV
jgi:hypothetical protein